MIAKGAEEPIIMQHRGEDRMDVNGTKRLAVKQQQEVGI